MFTRHIEWKLLAYPVDIFAQNPFVHKFYIIESSKMKLLTLNLVAFCNL